MKLRATIKDIPVIGENIVIVKFEGDEKQQHFEVRCDFNPYRHRMRVWDSWDFWIKWESEIFTDEKTQVKSYFTHLVCSKAEPFYQIGNGK